MDRTYRIKDLGSKNNIPDIKPVNITWLKRDDRKIRINIAGLGSVGSTLLMGLALLGRDDIERIGIYDLNKELCQRWEMEGNQIREACSEKETPTINILKDEELFDCEVFVFCIAKTIPPLDAEVEDVRMFQFEANRKIVENYAKGAAECGYKGLFIVVSDPVDLLCMAAFKASTEIGSLHPYQIQGCGLGVMNARAFYYAKKESIFGSFVKEGRVFGPHGKNLVVANSIIKENYDDELSKKLTELTVNANLKVRELGYKPYVAPALSSAAFTILRIIRGEWNYSACYLNGVYFGAKNRTIENGFEWEEININQKLFNRLQNAWDSLYGSFQGITET